MSSTGEYISALKADDIPWHRLVSSYGKADQFPSLLECLSGDSTDQAVSALGTLAGEIEHQDTLWPCTPFALVFLVRELKAATIQPQSERNTAVAIGVLNILENVAEVCAWAFGVEHADPLPRFADMLDEEHLLPADMQVGFDFSDELFFSFYYYSHEVLGTAAELCSEPADGALRSAAAAFLETLDRCGEH